MENQKQTTKKGIKKSRGVNASIVILVCLILAVLFFRYVLGNASNFEDGNIDNHPLNLLGTMYKGGFVVPIILTLLLTVIVISVERFFALNKAKGKGNLIRTHQRQYRCRSEIVRQTARFRSRYRRCRFDKIPRSRIAQRS